MPVHEYILVPAAQFSKNEKKNKECVAAKSTSAKRVYPKTFAEEKRQAAFTSFRRDRSGATEDNNTSDREEEDDDGSNGSSLHERTERKITDKLVKLIDKIEASKITSAATTAAAVTAAVDAAKQTSGKTQPNVSSPSTTQSRAADNTFFTPSADSSYFDETGMTASDRRTPPPVFETEETPKVLQSPLQTASTSVDIPRTVTSPKRKYKFFKRDIVEGILKSDIAKARGRSVFNILMSQPNVNYQKSTDTYDFNGYHISSTKRLAHYLKDFVSRQPRNTSTPPSEMQRFLQHVESLPNTIDFASVFYKSQMENPKQTRSAPKTSRSTSSTSRPIVVKLKKTPTIRKLLAE